MNKCYHENFWQSKGFRTPLKQSNRRHRFLEEAFIFIIFFIDIALYGLLSLTIRLPSLLHPATLSYGSTNGTATISIGAASSFGDVQGRLVLPLQDNDSVLLNPRNKEKPKSEANFRLPKPTAAAAKLEGEKKDTCWLCRNVIKKYSSSWSNQTSARDGLPHCSAFVELSLEGYAKAGNFEGKAQKPNAVEKMNCGIHCEGYSLGKLRKDVPCVDCDYTLSATVTREGSPLQSF